MASGESSTPLDDAAQHTADAVAQTEEAVEDVVAEVIADVADDVEEATTTATEAAAEAAEAIEEAVEEAVEGAGDVPNDMADEVYNRVMNALREAGTIPTDAMVEEVAGDAIEVGEDVVVDAVAAPDVVVEAATDAARDTIAPRREHFWTRPRRAFGREW